MAVKSFNFESNINATGTSQESIWYHVIRPVIEVVSSAVWFVYDTLITRQLRIFYFEGYVWGGESFDKVCYKMLGMEPEHWTMSPENIARCRDEMERRFQSWDKTAMSVVYFAMLTYIVIRLASYCCSFTKWRSTSCDYHKFENTQMVTRKELRDLLRNIIQEDIDHQS